MTFRRQQTPTQWDAARQLRTAMEAIFRTIREESRRAGRPEDLALGARAAAFRRIAEAMLTRGW